MATQKRRPESLLDDPGVWFGITLLLVISAFLIAGLVGLSLAATAIAAVAVGGVTAARLPGPIALATGVVAWAFSTGFFENAFGQLTFGAGDLVRLGPSGRRLW